jgi:ATP-dependent helicase/nuclease subunit B
LEQVLTLRDGKELLAETLRDYASGLLPKTREKEFFTLFAAFDEMEKDERENAASQAKEDYLKAAFLRHEDRPLLQEISRQIYGQLLENSVSRLETYAGCAYKHFLQYGLSLKEREEFGYEAVDFGNIYHG